MHREAFAIMRQYPKDLAWEMVSGFPKLMLGSDFSWAIYFLHPKIDGQQLSAAKNDVLHLRFNQLVSRYDFGILSLIVLVAVCSLFSVIFYFLMSVGFYQCFKREYRKHLFSHLFLLGCMLYFIAMSSSPISYSRFRLPIELLITVYASFGFTYLLMRSKARQKFKVLCHE